MPEEPEPAATQPEEIAKPEEPNEEDIGDFITRHVLEKDAVFFEG